MLMTDDNEIIMGHKNKKTSYLFFIRTYFINFLFHESIYYGEIKLFMENYVYVTFIHIIY